MTHPALPPPDAQEEPEALEWMHEDLVADVLVDYTAAKDAGDESAAREMANDLAIRMAADLLERALRTKDPCGYVIEAHYDRLPPLETELK